MIRLRDEKSFPKPAPLLEQEAFMTIQRNADRLMGEMEEILKDHNLSPAQYNVLRILRTAGPVGWPAMKSASDIDHPRDPDMTRLLDKLEERRVARPIAQIARIAGSSARASARRGCDCSKSWTNRPLHASPAAWTSRRKAPHACSSSFWNRSGSRLTLDRPRQPTLRKENSMQISRHLAIAGLVLFWAGIAQADSYKLDPAHSFANFRIPHFNVGHVYGRINAPEGTITIDSSDPAKDAFDITLKAANIDTSVAARQAPQEPGLFFRGRISDAHV